MKGDGLMIALRLAGRRCLVVGSGDEAATRAQRLLDAGAAVVVVAEAPGDALRALATVRAFVMAERPFVEADLDGCRLAVLTDRDEALAARIDAACAASNVLFCAVDQPAHGDYFHVAIAERGPLTIGISTGGKVPALAGRLREAIARLLDDERLDAFMAELEALRARAEPTERAGLLRRAVQRLSLEGRLEIGDEPEDG